MRSLDDEYCDGDITYHYDAHHIVSDTILVCESEIKHFVLS